MTNLKIILDDHLTSIVAIICVCLIELKALEVGLDGEILLTSIGLITAVGGYNYGKNKKIQKGKTGED